MQQAKWNTRFNFRSAEPSEVVQLSVGVNNQAYTGISRTTPEQLSLFEALKLPKPAKSAV
jgi:hypothetical protein